MGDTILTKTAKITYHRNEKLLYIEVFPGSEITLQDSKEHRKATLELTSDEMHCTLIVALGHIDMTAEVREYAADPDTQKYCIAQAICVNTLGTRISSNFYINFNKPDSPTKIFTNLEDAKSWLMYKRKEYEEKQK